MMMIQLSRMLRVSRINISRDELIQTLVNDSSLQGLLMMARKANNLRSANAYSFTEGELIRKCKDGKSWKPIVQVVLPTCFRDKLISVARENEGSQKLWIKKTVEKLHRQFYWPNMYGSARDFSRMGGHGW